MPCIHPVWENEIGAHVKNQPAQLPLDGDHIHAAFPSSNLHMFLCPSVSFTSYLPVTNRVSIWFSVSILLIKIPCILLDSGLCCQACLQCDRIVSGLVVYIYLLLDVSLQHCLSRNFLATSTTLGSMWLSWSPALLSSQGLWTEIYWKGCHGGTCRAMSPRWFPQVSLPLAFYFQHIYVASFLSAVLTFRK